VALLLVDLNRFKELNDSLGHDAGDRLLEQLGARLVRALPDAVTIARIGGDEFAALFVGDFDDTRLGEAAERVRRALEAPFPLCDMRFFVSASIGGALAPRDAAGPSELLQRADVAMTSAKRRGLAYALYRADQDDFSRERLELLNQLREALTAGNQIEVHFQPQAAIRSREIVGVEALVRWRHPERGLVAPASFVELAEAAGLLRPLTRRVLCTALEQVAAWRGKGLDLTVSVNVGAADLLDPDFPQEVADALWAAGVPAGRLVLEITENVVLAEPECWRSSPASASSVWSSPWTTTGRAPRRCGC
jgi:diguanylate cyclase (GGDEF)-like protein